MLLFIRHLLLLTALFAGLSAGAGAQTATPSADPAQDLKALEEQLAAAKQSQAALVRRMVEAIRAQEDTSSRLVTLAATARQQEAQLAKTTAMLCVRNTHLETIHAGKTPVTRTGEWTDVTVVDADGNRIRGTMSRASPTMKCATLCGDIVDRLYTLHVCADEPGLQAEIERSMAVAGQWDEPEIDTMMLKQKSGAA